MSMSECEYLEHRIRRWIANKKGIVTDLGEKYYERHLEQLEKGLEEARAREAEK